MKGKGVWIVAGLVAVAAAAAFFLLRWSGAQGSATLVEAFNQVDAHPRPRQDWGPAMVGMAIYGGGQVRTGVASSARLELLEGVVRLAAESIFTVKECAVRRGEVVTTLFLEDGRLWAHLRADPPHQFSVETASAVAAVRDTRLSVKAALDGTTLVSVAEGEIELVAQGESVRVVAGQQASVEAGRPPGRPEPMSDEERALWATEGEMPELAPPTPTPSKPAEVSMWVDVYSALTGPPGDPASRNPHTKLETHVERGDVRRVQVETPDGEVVIIPSYGDIYGQERRFLRDTQALPQAGGSYTFTALDAAGAPMPGGVMRDVYLGGYEPDPPSHIRAAVVEAGLLVTWDPSPAISGAFEPSGSPPFGFYQITLVGEGTGMVYGWHHAGRSIAEPSHLVPFRRQDFGPGDLGRALEEMEDGIYYLSVTAFSAAPEGTAGQGHECSAHDPAQDIRLIIEGGQVRVEAP